MFSEVLILSLVFLVLLVVAILFLRQSFRGRLESTAREADVYRTQADALRSDNQRLTLSELDLTRRLAETSAQKQAMEERIVTHSAEMEEMKKQFRTEFENLANEILERKSTKFTELNKENIDRLLKPLGQNIETFQKRVNEVYSADGKDRASLVEQIKMLVEMNNKTREEAHNLAEALKGNSKVQGDWGEMILERILESSGLKEGREYRVQDVIRDEDGATAKSEQGRMMRPDVVIYYPDNRKIVVDAKVSLKAYADYANASDDAARESHLAEHIASIKRHVDELSAKKYQDYIDSVDFVMMFVPNESAAMVAMGRDSSLWDYAYAKRVIMISPTNLISSLKIIADLWKREDQSRNAQKIAKKGADLYDKLAGFVENFTAIGAAIERSQSAYEKALGQLRDGKGNLLRRAEEMRKLGLKPSKSLTTNETIEEEEEEDEI